jgi:hypothetical protein
LILRRRIENVCLQHKTLTAVNRKLILYNSTQLPIRARESGVEFLAVKLGNIFFTTTIRTALDSVILLLNNCQRDDPKDEEG